MPVFSDQLLLQQLREEENASFSLLYRFYFPMIQAHVTQNGGQPADAEDIFQETIIVLLAKVRNPGFELTSSLKTYLYAIAKNQWLKKLRAKKLVNADFIDEALLTDGNLEDDHSMLEDNQQKLGNWMTKITQHCRKVLHAIFYIKVPVDKLMRSMGWKNKHTAANQQYKCIQQLKKEQAKDESV